MIINAYYFSSFQVESTTPLTTTSTVTKKPITPTKPIEATSVPTVAVTTEIGVRNFPPRIKNRIQKLAWVSEFIDLYCYYYKKVGSVCICVCNHITLGHLFWSPTALRLFHARAEEGRIFSGEKILDNFVLFSVQ